MKFKTSQDGYMIRLFKGEKIIENLLEFCKSEQIQSGILQGLGGAQEAVLGFYDVDKKEYEYKTFTQTLEIANLVGNISLVDNQPFLHIHVVISDRNFNAFAGHLKEATAGATCEVFIRRINMDLTRKLDEEVGLKLLDLE